MKKEAAKERRRDSIEGWRHSSRQKDVLTISISGAGIYVALETLKFSADHPTSDLWIIKLAGLLFVIAIIFSFISQDFGEKSNYNDVLMCDEIIDADDAPTKEQEKEISKYDALSGYDTKIAGTLDNIALITMFIGLAVILIFFLITF